MGTLQSKSAVKTSTNACIVSHCLYIDKGYVYLLSFFTFSPDRSSVTERSTYCCAAAIAVRLLLRFEFFKGKNGGAATITVRTIFGKIRYANSSKNRCEFPECSAAVLNTQTVWSWHCKLHVPRLWTCHVDCRNMQDVTSYVQCLEKGSVVETFLNIL